MRHATAARLVPDLVAGQIRGWRRLRLVRHARDCADCQTLHETYAAISDAYRGPESHPDSERLAVFAIDRERVEPEERGILAAHLESCAACAADVRTIEAVEEGNAPETGIPARAPTTQWIQWRLRPALAGAGLAVLFFAWTAFVALNGLGIGASRNDGRQAGDDPSQVAIVPLVVLRTPLREGGATVPQVQADELAPTVVLALDVSTWLADVDHDEQVQFSLTDSALRSLWRDALTGEQIRRAAGATGAIALSVPRRVLLAGRFRVVGERTRRPAGPLFEIEFDVVKRAG